MVYYLIWNMKYDRSSYVDENPSVEGDGDFGRGPVKSLAWQWLCPLKMETCRRSSSTWLGKAGRRYLPSHKEDHLDSEPVQLSGTWIDPGLQKSEGYQPPSIAHGKPKLTQ